MKIFRVQVTDKTMYDEETGKVFESYIGVCNSDEMKGELNPPGWISDENIHFYFTEDKKEDGYYFNGYKSDGELKVGDTIETDEFKYLILGEEFV